MQTSSVADDPDNGLPPAGSRWGSGARSVLPYLTKSLQSRPSSGPEAREPRVRDLQHPAEERPGASPSA